MELFKEKNKQLQFFGTSSALVAIMFFSLYAVFGKVLLQNFTPAMLLFAGEFISVLMIVFFVGFLPEIKKFYKLSNKEKFYLIFTSIITGAISPFLFLKGLEHCSATDSILFMSTEAVFFAIAGSVFLKEKVSLSQILGTVFMFLGIVIIATLGFQKSFSLNIGYLLILGSALFGAISGTIFKKHLQKVSPELTVFSRNTIGAIIIISIAPIFINFQEEIQPFFQKEILTSLLLYVIFVIILAQLLWYKALAVIPTSKSSIISLLKPIFGIFFSALFLQEILQNYHFFGILIMLIGLGVTRLHLHRNTDHHEKIRNFKFWQH